MKFLTRSVVSLLLIMSSVCVIAQVPTPPPMPEPIVEDGGKAVITDFLGRPAPVKAKLGKVLILSCKTSTFGKSPKSISWRVSPAYLGVEAVALESKTVLIIPTGAKLPPSGLAIEAQLTVSKNDVIDTAVIVVQVVDNDDPIPDPEPTPGPTPNPTPKPPISDFSKSVFTLTQSKIPVVEVRKAISEAFQIVGEELKAGKVTTIPDMLDRTQVEIVNRIGLDDFLKYIDVSGWRKEFTGMLEKLNITDVKDHAEVWFTVSKAIK